jgi:surface antigen|tara:strand:- start:42 stop:524 length:483 start_codon:yes stop_codon:yes gene_type:complete
MKWKKVIRIFIILLLLSGCTQNQVKTHMGTGAGAVTGYATCRSLLNSNIELTAACTLAGAWLGSSMFYTNDMNIHTAVFVDTLNTSPGVISNANWGNSATGNWGSIKINRTYLVGMKKCKDYESTISITQSWPFTGVKRGTEHGIACQMPDGRWIIEAAS